MATPRIFKNTKLAKALKKIKEGDINYININKRFMFLQIIPLVIPYFILFMFDSQELFLTLGLFFFLATLIPLILTLDTWVMFGYKKRMYFLFFGFLIFMSYLLATLLRFLLTR